MRAISSRGDGGSTGSPGALTTRSGPAGSRPGPLPAGVPSGRSITGREQFGDPSFPGAGKGRGGGGSLSGEFESGFVITYIQHARGAASAGGLQRSLERAWVAPAAFGNLCREMFYFGRRRLLGGWKRFCGLWESVKCFISAAADGLSESVQEILFRRRQMSPCSLLLGDYSRGGSQYYY